MLAMGMGRQEPMPQLKRKGSGGDDDNPFLEALSWLRNPRNGPVVLWSCCWPMHTLLKTAGNASLLMNRVEVEMDDKGMGGGNGCCR